MNPERQIAPEQGLAEANDASPFFSIIIPTYNRAQLLERAIDSVLTQSFESFELLILDDGSTDATKQTVEALKDPRLRYFQLAHRGAAHAQNVGAEQARGEFLLFLDSDDEALPGWLSTIAANDNGKTILISIDGWNVESGETTRHGPRELAYPGSGWVALILSGTYAVRRSVFQDIGGFDESLPSGTKTDLSLKLLDHLADHPDSTVYVDSPLVRHHRNSPLSVRNNDRAVLEGTEMLLDRYASALAGVPDVRADYHGVAGIRAARLGDIARARRHLWASAKADPTNPRRWARLAASWVPLGFRVWGHPS